MTLSEFVRALEFDILGTKNNKLIPTLLMIIKSVYYL